MFVCVHAHVMSWTHEDNVCANSVSSKSAVPSWRPAPVQALGCDYTCALAGIKLESFHCALPNTSLDHTSAS